MSITAATQSDLRRTTKHDAPFNGIGMTAMISAATMTNVGPVAVNPAGQASSGQPTVIEAVGLNGSSGYIGMNLDGAVANGAALNPQRNVIVGGYSGVNPGKPVFVDPSSNASSGTTATGLTHTDSSNYAAGTIYRPIGVGLTGNRIYFF